MSFTLKPALDEDFFNREKIVSEMVETLTSPGLRMGFALIGPRRVGKTSILREVERILKGKKGIVPIYFSMWELIEKTGKEFVYLFSHRIIESYRNELSLKYKIRNAVKLPAKTIISILKTTELHLRIFDEVEIILERKNPTQEYIAELIREVFRLPEYLALNTKTRCILIIDEFPTIMELKNKNKLGEGIIRVVRTINEEYKNAILCISGSIRKTMETAVLSSSSPFYRQLIIKNIAPFKRKDVYLLLKSNIEGELTPQAIDYLFAQTKGIPFYIQCIGKKLLQQQTKEINLQTMEKVLQEFLREEGDLIFTEMLENLSSRERGVLICLAKTDTERLSQISRQINEDMNITGRYLNYLVNKGIVEKKERGKYVITDPVFEKWLLLKGKIYE